MQKSRFSNSQILSILKQFDFKASMSRKGNCCDNAPMESSWGRLKHDMIHHRKYATRNEAELGIRKYIEILDNR